MYVVCVSVHVKPEHREAFIAATRDNASGSIHEPGNLRFDVVGQIDDPDHFALYEVYTDEAAFVAHQQTPHYQTWKDTVADWMAQPRHAFKCNSLFPDDPDMWKAIRE